MKVPVFIRVTAGQPVMGCCPLVPGLCVHGASVTEVVRGMTARLKQELLRDASALQASDVTLVTLDLSDELGTERSAREPMPPGEEPAG